MKKWYKSKTIRINLAAILVALIFGENVPAEYEMVALAIINMALRLITKEEIDL